ncbi:MAG: glycoside hydrolase family 25 protein [Oscillospiraceae bacterium]|nr:glycoside hydrolase family 25 protein [Oscillospiraceae bacterium]MDY6208309.1 glycoside hydrolase family 25 protein [Oscillospiraceae bacterium]
MSKNPLTAPCIILSAMTVLTLGTTCLFIARAAGLSKDNESLRASATVAEAEISRLNAELETAVHETEAVTGIQNENMVYIYDNGIEKIEYPEINGAVFNDYDMNLLETDEKKHKTLFDESGNKRSRFGIDVSSYQQNIDWQAVKADGVEFAILRIGYRGYETGQLTEDKYFRRNLEGAKAAGIETGVYFFSQALTSEEALEEAEYVINLLAETGAELAFPVVFDWEFPTDEDPARTDGMAGEIQTVCCRVFCDRIKEAGYEPMYYSTINTAIFRYDMGELSDIPLWLADYNRTCNFTYDYKMWQYSCSGVVDGIEGLVDFNIWITE